MNPLPSLPSLPCLSTLLLLLSCCVGSSFGFASSASAGETSSPQTLALVGGTIFPSPTQPPIAQGVLLIRDGKIVAMGAQGAVSIPANAQILDCQGRTLMAGFWNSHVHFTEAIWAHADTAPAAQLAGALRRMLTRYGFTSVFDTGSVLKTTAALRRRIVSGEIPGPTIRTAGMIIFPKGAAAFMLSGAKHQDAALPVANNASAPPPSTPVNGTTPAASDLPDVALCEAATPDQARALVRDRIAGGADAIKLYVQAWWNLDLKLSPDVVQAAVQEAHRAGRMVLAHPSNQYGLETAIEGGVDELMHTTPQTGPWSDALIARMKAHHIAITPTLTLWRFELTRAGAPAAEVDRFQEQGVQQLAAWFRAGGTVLFGTDVGYMTDYDPTEEYLLMARAGMTFRDILASLTTTPASRFAPKSHAGTLSVGAAADIVALEGDPATDVHHFAKVRWTIRAGRILYDAAAP